MAKSIPWDKLCNDTPDSPLVKSLWDNILQDVDQSRTFKTNTQDLPEKHNYAFTLRSVNSFSYAKGYINKYKIREKTGKSKALRKELKRKSSDKE